MKKYVVAVPIVLALCLAGCNGNGTQTTSAATSEVPVASTTAASETTEAATAVQTTAETALTLPKERLFGGYIAGENDAELKSAPDENTDTVKTIPAGTQIEIYGCDKDGWYMTSFDGKIGYISAKYVAEIPAYDMEEIYVPDLHDIAGKWIYEQLENEGTDETSWKTIGYFEVSADGEYRYTTDLVNYVNGTVKITYEEYVGGTKIPLFSFYDEKGELFTNGVALAPEQRPDECVYLGNCGSERLHPDNDEPLSDEQILGIE